MSLPTISSLLLFDKGKDGVVNEIFDSRIRGRLSLHVHEELFDNHNDIEPFTKWKG
jgi:hypothetical protein